MKTNQAGIELIKSFEGFSNKIYLCPAGVPTIGYGHAIKKGETFTTLTTKGAESLLQKDLEFFEARVSELVKTPLTSNQFSALVSFTYNTGAGKLKSSTLLRLLNLKDYEGAAAQFMRWIYAGKTELPGLVRRRKAEQVLFNTK